MKKWLVSVLCVLLFVTMLPMGALSVAAEGTESDPFVCEDLYFNMIEVPGGETYYFMLDDSANYAAGIKSRQVSVHSGDDPEAGYALHYNGSTARSDVDGYCNVVVQPDANGVYLLSVTNDSEYYAAFFIAYYEVEPYTVSAIELYEGENAVTAELAEITIFGFLPEAVGYYSVTVDKPAILSSWQGSSAFVTGMVEETDSGTLMVLCTSVGQTLLIGMAGVDSASLTITPEEGYVPPEELEYVEYVNQHTPVEDFAMPEEATTSVDVTKPQTVVADADGIYHLGSENGPILYVNMRAGYFADLYACYHPTAGGGALFMRGRYTDENGEVYGYEFLEAMRPYAEALDGDGYYYLTVDLAIYIQSYGKNQGWFNPASSEFPAIQSGNFIEESAWLVNACYVAPAVTVGDINGDGRVNNRDLGALQQYLNEWDVVINEAAADVNDDGRINNRDLGVLQQYLNEWDVELG